MVVLEPIGHIAKSGYCYVCHGTWIGHRYVRHNNWLISYVANGTTESLGLASITGGALALVTPLLAKREAEKKKLKPDLATRLV